MHSSSSNELSWVFQRMLSTNCLRQLLLLQLLLLLLLLILLLLWFSFIFSSFCFLLCFVLFSYVFWLFGRLFWFVVKIWLSLQTETSKWICECIREWVSEWAWCWPTSRHKSGAYKHLMGFPHLTHTHAHTNKDKQASSECKHSGLLSSLSRKALYELSLLRSYTNKGSNAIRNWFCIWV